MAKVLVVAVALCGVWLMTDWAVIGVVAFLLVGATVLAELLYSFGTIFFFVFVASIIWFVVRVWKGMNNG